jgi:hypothetical protein
VEIESSSAAVEDKTFASHRYRVGLIVGRHVVSLGSAEVIAAVGPALDRWTLEGADPRIRVGGEGRLKVRMPLGERIALENGLIVGLSASPWEAGDLTPSEFRQTLRTLAVSAGIRVRL